MGLGGQEKSLVHHGPWAWHAWGLWWNALSLFEPAIFTPVEQSIDDGQASLIQLIGYLRNRLSNVKITF